MKKKISRKNSLNKNKTLSTKHNKQFSQSQNSFLLKGRPLYKKWNENNYKQKFAFNIFGRPKIEEEYNWNDYMIIENNDDLFINSKYNNQNKNKIINNKNTNLNLKIQNNFNYYLKGTNIKKNNINNFQIVKKTNEYLIQSQLPYKMVEKISQLNDIDYTIKNFQRSVPNLIPILTNEITIKKEKLILSIQKNSILNFLSKPKILFLQPFREIQVCVNGKKKEKNILKFQNMNKFTFFGKKIKDKILQKITINEINIQGIKKKIIFNSQKLNQFTIRGNIKEKIFDNILVNQITIEGIKKNNILYFQNLNKFTIYGKKFEKKIFQKAIQFNIKGIKKPTILNLQYLNEFTIHSKKNEKKILQKITINQFNIEGIKKQIILNVQYLNKFTIHSKKNEKKILQKITINRFNIEGIKKQIILNLQYLNKFSLYGFKKEKLKLEPYRICQVYYTAKKSKKNLNLIKNIQLYIPGNKKKIEFIPIKVNKFDIINKPLIFKSVPMKKKIPNEIQSNIQFSLKRNHHFTNLNIRKYNNLIITNESKNTKIHFKINKIQFSLFSKSNKKQIFKQIKNSSLNILGIKKESQIIYIKQEPEKIYIKQEPQKIYIKQQFPSWNITNKIYKNNNIYIYPKIKPKNYNLSYHHQNFEIFSIPKNYEIIKNNDINYISTKRKWNELNIYQNNEKFTFSKKNLPELKISKNEISFRKKSSDSEIIINDGDFSDRKENKEFDDSLRKRIVDELFQEDEPKIINILKNPHQNIPKKNNNYIQENDYINRTTKNTNEIKDIQVLLRKRNSIKETELLREFKEDKNPFP